MRTVGGRTSFTHERSVYRPASEPSVEEVAAGVDRDVVAPGRQEDASRRPDRVEEVGKAAVHVHRDPRVAEDVVLVERAHEPRVDRLVRAQERGDRGVQLRRRPDDDDTRVDGLARDVERVDLLLAVVVHRRVDAEDAEDRERRRRPAVDARAILARACVARLQGLERRDRRTRERRARDPERVRDPPHVASTLQQRRSRSCLPAPPRPRRGR